MIFPSEAVLEARRDLVNERDAGEITEEEYARQLLEADPDDSEGLRFFALRALEADQFAEAQRFARELMRVHPGSYEGYLVLAQAAGSVDPASPVAAGYGVLALQKIKADGQAAEQLDLDDVARQLHMDDGVGRRPLPDSLEQELEPHRLIQQVFESCDDLLDRGVVDGILKNDAGCTPLLLGVLKEWGEGQLAGEDRPVVERALALLGEIGNVETLPAIVEFLTLNEDDLSGPADWAFRRLAFQHPGPALERVRQMIPGAKGEELFFLAQQIGEMPDVPGRREALTSIAGDIERVPIEQREAVMVAVISSAVLMEGGSSPLAASLERRHAGLISRQSRADLRGLRGEVGALVPAVAEPNDLTIHQICCELPAESDDDSDDAVPEPVVRAPKPGRNEPCWCGSGKKYKKCHLAEDELR